MDGMIAKIVFRKDPQKPDEPRVCHYVEGHQAIEKPGYLDVIAPANPWSVDSGNRLHSYALADIDTAYLMEGGKTFQVIVGSELGANAET